MMTGKVANWVPRLLLVGVFLWSGIVGLLDQRESPGHWSFWIIPSLEVLIVLICLIAKWRALFLLIGAYFITSGILKIGDLQSFTEAVGNYGLAFPGDELQPLRYLMEKPRDAYVAYSLPWLEVFVGAMIIIGFGRKLSLLIVMGLLVFFNFLIAMAMFQGLNINCGCHGEQGEATYYPLKLAVNTGLWIISALLLVLDCKRTKALKDQG